MWKWNKQTNAIQVTEGDWGVSLPFIVSGVTLSASDSFRLDIKRGIDKEIVLTKTFIDVHQNTFNLVINEDEALPVGTYVYNLDWYQNGLFMCNIINGALFKVVNKA